MVNQSDKQQVRLWVDGIDYGTMSKRAAELYAIEHYRLYPDEPLTIEPVKEEESDGDPDR